MKPLSHLALIVALFNLLGDALGHDAGLSTVSVRLQPGIINITAVFSEQDAEALTNVCPGHRGVDVLPPSKSHEVFEIRCDDRPVGASLVGYHLDGASNTTMRLWARTEAFAKLAIRSKCFASLPSGHRQFLTLQNGDGKVVAERLLSAATDSITIELNRPETAAPSSAPKHSVADFLLLGVRHILTGYDHLLFLFSLLLVTRSVVPTLKIITSFTVAHSITLALAALSIVRISSTIVEPIIAASIVFLGLENLVRREMPKGRVVLTFAFGLVHGLGFASALREVGFGADGSGIIQPLISFNVGVELGQLLVAAIALPLLCQLTARSNFTKRWIPASSAFVVLAGSYWFVQRVWFT